MQLRQPVDGVHGTRLAIEGGGYRAEIVTVGASLQRLVAPDGRDLVLPSPLDQPRQGARGAILAPWPNRIEDGQYTFDGVSYQLPLTEVKRGNASHGLVRWERWSVLRRGSAEAALGLDLVPQPGYPFPLRFTAEYSLDDEGLHWSVLAENLGARPAPYAIAVHPYLLADVGGGTATDGTLPVGEAEHVDGWTLRLPADSVTIPEPERLLPLRDESVDGGPFDLRAGRSLSRQTYDHAFTGLRPDSDGWTRATLTGRAGRGVELAADPETRWFQVYTDDHGSGAPGRRGVAIEPMTAPANAFRSERDLVRLSPGETHRAAWTIAAIG